MRYSYPLEHSRPKLMKEIFATKEATFGRMYNVVDPSVELRMPMGISK